MPEIEYVLKLGKRVLFLPQKRPFARVERQSTPGVVRYGKRVGAGDPENPTGLLDSCDSFRLWSGPVSLMDRCTQTDCDFRKPCTKIGGMFVYRVITRTLRLGREGD